MTSKPIIGISSSITMETEGNFSGYKRIYLSKDYVDAVIQNGGIPFVIPINNDLSVIEKQIEMIDGLILSGGHDVSPYLYGEEPAEKLGEICPDRDNFDMELFRIAKSKNIPILGICRGMQLINICEGGTLYQDLSYIKNDKPILKHVQDAMPYDKTHYINVKENSKVFDIFQSKKFMVNSFHHQAIKDVAKNYEVTAYANDGVVEAIENKNNQYIVAVQWHPEMLFKYSEEMNNIFIDFIKEAKNKINS